MDRLLPLSRLFFAASRGQALTAGHWLLLLQAGLVILFRLGGGHRVSHWQILVAGLLLRLRLLLLEAVFVSP